MFNNKLKADSISNAVSKIMEQTDEVHNLDELSKKTLGSYVKAASADVAQRGSAASFKSGKAGDMYNKAPDTAKDTKREKGMDKALSKLTKEDSTFSERLLERIKQMKEKKDSILVPEEEISETLSKKSSAGNWISDFEKSDNPKFSGKSKEKRKQMALAAYYGKQREGVEVVDEAMDTKADVPAALRKAKGYKPLTPAELNEPKHGTMSRGDTLRKSAKNEESDSDVKYHPSEIDDKVKTTDTLAGRISGKTSKFIKAKVKLETTKEEIDHDDEKEDKKLIKKMVKEPCLTKESSMFKKIKEMSKKSHQKIKETLGKASPSEVYEDNELDEDSSLETYLKSIGMNPEYMTREKKIGISRSPGFQAWLKNHA